MADIDMSKLRGLSYGGVLGTISGSSGPSIMTMGERDRNINVTKRGYWFETFGCGAAHRWPGSCDSDYDPEAKKCVESGEMGAWPFAAQTLFSMLGLDCGFDDESALTDELVRAVSDELAVAMTRQIEWSEDSPSLAAVAKVLTKDSDAVSIGRGISILSRANRGKRVMLHGPALEMAPMAPLLFRVEGQAMYAVGSYPVNPGPGWRGVIPLDDTGGDGTAVLSEGEAYLYSTRSVPKFNFMEPQIVRTVLNNQNKTFVEALARYVVAFGPTCEVYAVRVLTRDIEGVTI